jgi:FimV-like protein
MYRKVYQFILVTASAGFLLTSMGVTTAFCQNTPDAGELLQMANEKMAEADEPAAMELYEQVIDEDPQNYEALWNLSILYSKKGQRQENEEETEQYFIRSLELAEQVLEHHPDKSYSHYVYAVAIGRLADISSPRERVQSSEEVKEHVDIALELDPENEAGWHLLGVWHTSAANLSRAERWAANLLFGGAPEGASNSEAERCLQKAIELDPGNILFHLDLARFYITTGREDEAAEVLNETLELEPRQMDDPDLQDEAREMLNEIS